MLAQNFKTAAELDLEEEWRDALIKTLVLFETGKMVHTSGALLAKYYRQDYRFTGHFNMSCWYNTTECGTVACLGGTAELVNDLEYGSLYKASRHRPKLASLFFPHRLGFEHDWSFITVEQAAAALRSYLTTGDARWDLALEN